jgi:uncharacterized protein (TIGR00730 family)
VATIAVFGSSMVLPESPEYITGVRLGHALGKAGFTVMTGSYQGIMEAVSQGASNAGAHVIGVTSAPIEAIRRRGPNRWVEQIIPYDTLRDRLLHLVMHADAYVVMPGGLGTFAELLLAWELMRVNDIPPRPLICFADYWESVLAPLRDSPYIREGYWELVQFADTPESITELIVRSLA